MLAIIAIVLVRVTTEKSFFRLGFDDFAIKARGSGHVQAFVSADESSVMDFNEGAFILIAEGRAGGAVGFVADDQIEVGQSMALLGLAQGFDGVVG